MRIDCKVSDLRVLIVATLTGRPGM